LWPTPAAWYQGESMESRERRRAIEKAKGRNANGFGVPLDMAVRMWPTPNERDYKGAPGAGSRDRGGHQASLPASVKDTEGSGSLNPTWVEWLMGYPLGWTDCGDSETPSSRKSRNGSGGV
jgi:hypothetical protein